MDNPALEKKEGVISASASIINQYTYLGCDVRPPGPISGISHNIGSFFIIPVSALCIVDVDVDVLVLCFELQHSW